MFITFRLTSSRSKSIVCQRLLRKTPHVPTCTMWISMVQGKLKHLNTLFTKVKKKSFTHSHLIPILPRFSIHAYTSQHHQDRNCVKITPQDTSWSQHVTNEFRWCKIITIFKHLTIKILQRIKQGNAVSQGKELPLKHYVSFLYSPFNTIEIHNLIICQRLLRKIHHDPDKYQMNFDDAI